MRGFAPRFVDLPGFVLGITKEIWEDGGTDRVRDYYAPETPVRSPDGYIVGSEAVLDATRATLAEFPDRQLLGEDVIWCGDDVDGFFSSHRIFSTATHLGAGAFGPPTGKELRYRAIADCAVMANQVYDEWLIRDVGAIVRQLGWHPGDFAAAQIAYDGGPQEARWPLLSQDVPPPVYTSSGNDDPVGRRYCESLSSLVTGRAGDIEKIYDRSVRLECPGALTGRGWQDAERFWSGLRHAFAGARLEIHHVIGRSDDDMAPRAAVRWSLTGSHNGAGVFGDPTGSPIHVMGISHAEFGPRGLRREFVLFDETAVWKQILLSAD